MNTVFMLAVIEILAAAAVSYGSYCVLRALRRRELLNRPELTEPEWFARYYPNGAANERLISVMRRLGQHLGIRWTRLHPDDRFTGSLGLRSHPMADEWLLELELFLEDWAATNDVFLEGFRPHDRLGDFMQQLDLRIGESRGA
jgi:hypothetical protein